METLETLIYRDVQSKVAKILREVCETSGCTNFWTGCDAGADDNCLIGCQRVSPEEIEKNFGFFGRGCNECILKRGGSYKEVTLLPDGRVRERR